MSFKTINLDEYKKLLKNKKKIFDMTFPTPESLNKYRDDDDQINQKLLYDEEINKQNKNLSEMFDKNLDKNLNKYFNEKNKVPFVFDMLNLGDNSTDLIKVDKHEDKNLLKDVFEIEDKYKFIKDEDIIDSFQKVFQDYNVVYKPHKKSKNIYVKYLLDKLYNSDSVPKKIFDHFNNSLTKLKSTNKRIPVNYNDDGKMIMKSEGNIKIKDLDKGILRVRYSNNRKLTNKLLRDDYKISKRMVNAIKFNKDIHKLSDNEKNIYYELQKFLNKEQDINVLIGSYISGNNSKPLYNKINKMLYNKLKNDLISKKEYSSLLNKINKSYQYMEYILNSNDHKVTNNCLRYNFKNPIRFINQKISLMSIIVFYNYFENITDKFIMTVTYNKNKLIALNFTNGSYNISDINQIIDDSIQESFNTTEKPIKLSIDVNRYAILIIVEENWELKLDKNFMNLFGFSSSHIREGYHRSDLIPKVDKVKFLSLYCNLVDNREDNEFLTNLFINGGISDQVTYENDNIYKSKNILNSTFNYIEICIKDQHNRPVNMKDLFQISVYIS